MNRTDARWALHDIYTACDYQIEVNKIHLRRGPFLLGWVETTHLIDTSGRTYAVVGGRRSCEFMSDHQALTLNRLVAHVRNIYREPTQSRRVTE